MTWPAVTASSGRLLQLIDAAQPVCDVVPTGAVLVHQLQVVDSKHLQSSTHSVDRTAACRRAIVQRFPEPLHSGPPVNLDTFQVQT